MRLWITVVLDSGGKVTLSGHDLSAEDVNEVFAILAGKTIESDTRAYNVSELQGPQFVDLMRSAAEADERVANDAK